MASLSYIVFQFFNFLMLIMLIRVFLSWIPNINWYKEPFYSLRKFTDLIFEPFRKLIPPIGMLDISPIFAFLVMSVVQKGVFMLLTTFGL